jgi:MoaA/NifB/PqqE/SkfB family radical SAM enzyme
MAIEGSNGPSNLSSGCDGWRLADRVLHVPPRDHSVLIEWQADLRIQESQDTSEVVDILFPLLAEKNTQVGRHCADLLAQLLDDVTFEHFASPQTDADLWQNAPTALLPALAGLERLGHHVAGALCAGAHNPEALSSLCGALGSQPALVAALCDVAISRRVPGLDRFPTLFDPYDSRRQIALSPSYRCSGPCSYCYSRGLVDRFPQDMGIESLRQVVEWMKRNSVGLLLLAGGEPSEYPGINTLLELLRREHLQAYLATHNVFERPLEAADRNVLERVSVHLWHKAAYSQGLWDRFRRNLEMWCRKGISLSMRYNLLDPAYRPADLFGVCAEFGIGHVSIGLPFPTLGGEGVPKEDLHLFAPLLMDLCEEGLRRGLKMRLAKPLPWCAFSEEQAHVLKRSGVLSSVCSIHHHRGTQNVMVNPDLSTFTCQALPSPKRSLLEIETTDDLADEYEDQVRAALLQPLYDRCVDCYYYAQRACQGACLAYKAQPGLSRMRIDCSASFMPAQEQMRYEH